MNIKNTLHNARSCYVRYIIKFKPAPITEKRPGALPWIEPEKKTTTGKQQLGSVKADPGSSSSVYFACLLCLPIRPEQLPLFINRRKSPTLISLLLQVTTEKTGQSVINGTISKLTRLLRRCILVFLLEVLWIHGA